MQGIGGARDGNGSQPPAVQHLPSSFSIEHSANRVKIHIISSLLLCHTDATPTPHRHHCNAAVTSIGWCLKNTGSSPLPSDDSTAATAAAATTAADCAWGSCGAVSAGATGQASPARCSPPPRSYLLSGWSRAAGHCPRSCRKMEHRAVCWQHSHFV
ncbi:uncharacterized protein MONOS_8048 [Monocercomonoides exilis]|uniref:uncharacterized protein n=1 Tax=Monocercomonoides exilis TaxID=2049356 RepID=UPI0035598944|nr:hypothetical protein MONOS_8048 [Monocercomonoides exilis]|eukprot:MONOS_8048.1-p1 / transcript=MONOS_8048.1 / gene=MONOS_8048 / organism=Monocercomonoides_exilis_PA203 / gene_product=unspecified product / transcript_product=unspecified product / location=Mono_scaffold00293:3180-3784(-) / protein_length=157 / sequence_SO=supercontig / SO=protein_coding / is_pseudo=false